MKRTVKNNNKKIRKKSQVLVIHPLKKSPSVFSNVELVNTVPSINKLHVDTEVRWLGNHFHRPVRRKKKKKAPK